MTVKLSEYLLGKYVSQAAPACARLGRKDVHGSADTRRNPISNRRPSTRSWSQDKLTQWLRQDYLYAYVGYIKVGLIFSVP